MILVLKPNGKVLLNDSGKPQLSTASPPQGDCCCNDECYGAGFTESFSGTIPDNWVASEAGGVVFGVEPAIESGKLVFETEGDGQGYAGFCLRNSLFDGEFILKITATVDVSGESDLMLASLRFTPNSTHRAVGDSPSSIIGSGAYELYWVKWGFSGENHWYPSATPATLPDTVAMWVYGTYNAIDYVEYYVNGSLVYTYTPPGGPASNQRRIDESFVYLMGSANADFSTNFDNLSVVFEYPP